MSNIQGTVVLQQKMRTKQRAVSVKALEENGESDVSLGSDVSSIDSGDSMMDFELDDSLIIDDEELDEDDQVIRTQNGSTKLNEGLTDTKKISLDHSEIHGDNKRDKDNNVETNDKVIEGLKKPKDRIQESDEANESKQTTIQPKIINNSCFSVSSGWTRMHLSKPLLKALSDLGFTTPTIIQRDAIPLALQGRDILGTAQTGSGKTAAFVLPILERLCRSPAVGQRRMSSVGPTGGGVATKALILLPTRELAVQCYDMLEALAKYTPITKVLITGGMSQKTQEMSFRRQPDIVVATPGRVLDLLLNSPSVHLELLEIVVLDEADRLLELGFKEECLRVLKHCSKSRQTLLFSATLSDAINDLASLSLNRPLRIDASSSHSLPPQLEQVLVPVPPSQEDVLTEREAILLHLCFESYKDKRTIVFFRTKKSAHRAALIFRLLGIPHAELHGNLTQASRLEALEKFHTLKSVRFLLCSELAARGLDISDVELVINFCVPPDPARYVHQVGRTARIGHSGTAVTLFAPDERLKVKKIIKTATKDASCPQPLRRMVHREVTAKWLKKINALEDNIKKILHDEHVERELRLAEMEVTKMANLRDFQDEIMSRPKKQWFGRLNNGMEVTNPTHKNEEELLSQIEKIDHQTDDNEEDLSEFVGVRENESEEALTDVDSEVFGDDEDIDGDKVMQSVKKIREKNGIDSVITPVTITMTKTKAGVKEVGQKKGASKDEKNRLQKGERKIEQRRLTVQQRAALADMRATKAIGKKAKKSKRLSRMRVIDGNSDDDGEPIRKAKKVKKKNKGLKRQVDMQLQPQKLTRKIRAANKKYEMKRQKDRKAALKTK